MIGSIFSPENYFFNPYAVPHILIGIVIGVEGFFIFLQNKRSLTNLAYLINCIFPAAWLTGAGIGLSSLSNQLALFWFRFYCFFGIIFIPAAVYLFSVIWKETLLKTIVFEESHKIFSLFLKKKSLSLIFFVSFIFYLFSLFSNNFLIDVWPYPWGFYPKGGLLLSGFIVWFFLIYVLALQNFIFAYQKAPSPLKKKQAKLIIVAFSVAVIGAIDFLPKYGVPLNLVGAFPTLIFISLVGYCVVRYKLMDIETVLHKTVAWFFTNLILIIPFVGALYLTYPWFSRLSSINVLLFLGFLGIIFLFFVRTFHPRIDHFFQRRRYDLEEIANQFTEDLVHLKGVVPLSRRLKEVIKNTLYSQKVSFFIYDSKKDSYFEAESSGKKNSELKVGNILRRWLAESNRVIHRSLIEIDPFYFSIKDYLKDYLNRTSATIVVPLILGGELLGLINIDKKANLKRYSSLDFHFLTVLKNQSAIAVSNSLLYENMEEQVKKRTQELIEIQKQLIQAEKMATVGTLAGGVAHEINNPLTAILTNVQFLLKFPDSEDKEALELMEEATKRCRTIVQKLMLYARKPSESGQREEVDILRVARDAVSLLGYQFKQENIEIKIFAEESNVYFVEANRNEIEQVITNLILNAKDAVKKIKSAGTIEIAVARIGSDVIVKVKDEGIGLSKKELSKIFDPFYTTKEVGKGTGLGLSICQSIIEKYDGFIEVISRPKEGAVFKIVLPATKVE